MAQQPCFNKSNMINKIQTHDVAKAFNSYPPNLRKKLLFLRQLVIETASESSEIGELEETLKWGEPSYLTKNGSTIRLGYKNSKPDQFAMYFHCKTKLVDTFKDIYRDLFKFEGNRAIIFNEHDTIPEDALKHCIQLSLTYHNIKHLPLLGV